MRTRNSIINFLLPVFLFAPFTLLGQTGITAVSDTIDIDAFVVTATRTDNRIYDIPIRVHSLSAMTLSAMPIQTVDDALKELPGMNINRPFGILSSKSTVSMRGLSGKEQGRVLVLLDGIPLNKTDGGTVDWNMIDAADIERIEVTKGAGSSIYGGSAMGGMINIITQKPTEKLSFKGSVEYGTFNTLGGNIIASGLQKLKNKDEFFWSLSTFTKESDGYITQSEADQKANPYIIRSDMEETGATLRTGFTHNNKHTFEAYWKFYNDRRGTGEKVYQPEGNTTDHDSYGITLNYKGKFEKFDIKSSTYLLTEDYKKVNEYIKDDYTWYNVLSKRTDLGWLNSATYSHNSHLLTGGFDIKIGAVDGEDLYLTSTDIVYNSGELFTAALFVQDEFSISEKINVIGGIRYDNATFNDGSFYIKDPSNETSFMFGYQVPVMPEKNWSALSPRFSVQYKLSATNRIYAMLSRGFRPSELEYLCRSGRIKGGFKIASPSLKPEYLTNYETGIDLSFGSKTLFSASLYYSKGKDFQYYVSNGETIDMGFGERPIFIRDNLGGVNIFGAEAELKYFITNGVYLNCTYAWAHSEITDYTAITETDTIDLDGKSFTDVPEHIATASIRVVKKLLSGSILARYTGSMFINDQNIIDEIIGSSKYPAYTTIDLKLWRDLSPNYRLSIEVMNLTNVKYYDSKYAVSPGRTIMGKLEFKL